MVSSSRGRGSFVAASLLIAAVRAASAAGPGFVLDLPGGGSLPGEFVPAAGGEEARETLIWQAPPFAAPLEFRLDELVGVRSAAGGPVAGEPRGFRCRLQGGDVIDGELRGFDAEHVELVIPGGELLKIKRGLVSSLVRGGAAAAGYVGPGGLVGWGQSPASSWRDEAGRITTDVANAMVARDVDGPARARYEIVLSWRKKPELRLAVAAGDGKAIDPFRFEMLSVRGDEPVAMIVRQEASGGMLEPLSLAAGEPGRLRLTLFVDQAAGRLAALVPGGEPVIDITVPPAGDRPPGSRFRLQLLSGDVCLERLRVSEWKAADPVGGTTERTRVVLRDGTLVEGAVIGLDPAGQLAVETDAGERTVALAEVTEVGFAGGPESPEGDADGVRVVRRGGGVLSGELVAITEDRLTIRLAGIDRPVPVPLADLQSLVSLRSSEPRPLPGRPGTMAVGGAEVPGCLVDAAAWGGGLAWLPRGSLQGSPLAGDPNELSAVVEYVPKATGAPDGNPGQVEIGGMGGAINQDENGFFVVTMLSEDGAAARDGRIEAGDRIVAIKPTADGPFVETAKLDLGMVMNLLRGRVGTPLGLRVQQGAGGRRRQVDLRRGLIYVSDRAVLDAALAAHATIAAGQGVADATAAGYPAMLVLRSGDIVAAAVERVDADGIRLRSPAAGSDGNEPITVGHGFVRAIEFEPAAASKGLAKPQWERLLTLPRSQQADPPTHLLRLNSGDYLRGNLESLDDEYVVFSVLGQSKQIPRKAVVRLIWLHGDEIEGRDPSDVPPADAAAAAPPAGGPDGVLVQGVAGGGQRTTLLAERLDGPMIVGTSPALGSSRIDTRRIDRLLIGKAIDLGDADLPFSKWRLKVAPLPRALRDD